MLIWRSTVSVSVVKSEHNYFGDVNQAIDYVGDTWV